MADKLWRQEIELLQNYGKHKSFTFTTTSGSAQDAVSLSGIMEEGNKISFVVELADAYIDFDGDASATTCLFHKMRDISMRVFGLKTDLVL